MKLVKITLVLASSILILASCGGNKKQAEKSEEFNIEDYIKTAEAIEPAMNRVEQVFSILDLVNAEYYDVLTNDPYSAHNYKYNYPIAAANLGIYITDIIYHLYGEENEKMYLSFAAAQELAKYLGIESEFGSWTIERLEGSAVNRDTVTKLFNSLLVDSENYNNEKEMVFVHTAFLTGSFVEKVHITGNILKQKLLATDLTKEDEGDIREMLVIYLNQLEPAAGVLYDAFDRQQDQLSSIVILSTFEKLKELSVQLKSVKSTLAVASIEDIKANQDLRTSFQLVEHLREALVNASN